MTEQHRYLDELNAFSNVSSRHYVADSRSVRETFRGCRPART